MALSLSSLRRSAVVRPPRIVIYGPEGVGKSSLAAQAPSPVFIQTEEGLDVLNVTAFPLATEYEQVEQALFSLINEEHDFQTAVIDTLDWLEHLIHRQIATENNVDSIDTIPYGKGYKLAIEKWRTIIEGLDILRNEKNMAIVLLAHSRIKRFEDPVTDSYDQYRLDMHDAATGLIDEWCDVIGFLTFHVGIKTRDIGFGKKEVKGSGAGERVLHTEGRPAYIAKSRYRIPPTLPMPEGGGWTMLESAITASIERPQSPGPNPGTEVQPSTTGSTSASDTGSGSKSTRRKPSSNGSEPAATATQA